MYKVDDRVRLVNLAPRCSTHKGQIGTIVKVKVLKNANLNKYFVKFSDGKVELHIQQHLEKIEE